MNARIFVLLGLLAGPAAAAAQTPPAAPAAPVQAPTPAAQPTPVRQPAAGSGPVIRQTELRFHPVNESIIEAQTYLYYIQTPLSRPSEGTWVPYTEDTERSLQEIGRAHV